MLALLTVATAAVWTSGRVATAAAWTSDTPSAAAAAAAAAAATAMAPGGQLPTAPSLVFTNGMGGVPCFRIPDVTTTNVPGELLAFAGAYCAASTDGCDAVGPRARNMTHGYVAMRRSSNFGSTWGVLTEVPGTEVPCDNVRTHADVIWDAVRNATVLLSQHQRMPCCRHPWEQEKPIITMTKSTVRLAWAAVMRTNRDSLS